MTAAHPPQGHSGTITHPPTVVIPGNHDGVHLGHQKLLQQAQAMAAKLGCNHHTALFFDPHPAAVLRPDRAPLPLTTTPRRKQLLLAAGANNAVALTFDHTFAKQSPEGFVEHYLLQTHRAQGIVVGPDFRFGKQRAGNHETLATMAPKLGFEVRTIAPLEVQGARISSSRVRTALSLGDLNTVHACLGRHHDFEGTVIKGQQRGRTIGFPTANLELPTLQLPKNGVYALWVRIDPSPEQFGSVTEILPGVMNIGTRPTVTAGQPAEPSVEVHLLDFEGDLYGKTLRVAPTHRLRDEQKFPGLDALKAQIYADAQQAKSLLSQTPETEKAVNLKWM